MNPTLLTIGAACRRFELSDIYTCLHSMYKICMFHSLQAGNWIRNSSFKFKMQVHITEALVVVEQ